MNSENLFAVTSTVTLCGWVLLASGMFIPTGSRWRKKILAIAGRIIPIAVAVIYVVVLIKVWGTPRSGTGLQQIVNLYSIPNIVLLGWMHFLVVDLFVGRWIVDDASSRAIKPWWIMPMLAVTLFYGPVGLLGYFVFREARRLRTDQ